MKNRRKKKKTDLAQQLEYWDKKLAESGFEDIEDRKTGLLKAWSGTISARINGLEPRYSGSAGYSSLIWKESQQDYYRAAGQVLHTGKFKSKKHKEIWKLHCDGLSTRQIAKELDLTQRQSAYAINRLQSQFGLRLSQLHKKEATEGSDNDTHSNKGCRARRSPIPVLNLPKKLLVFQNPRHDSKEAHLDGAPTQETGKSPRNSKSKSRLPF